MLSNIIRAQAHIAAGRESAQNERQFRAVGLALDALYWRDRAEYHLGVARNFLERAKHDRTAADAGTAAALSHRGLG